MRRSAAKLNLLPIAQCLTGGAIRAIANTATGQTSGTGGRIYHRKTSDRRSLPGISRFCRLRRTTVVTVKVSHRACGTARSKKNATAVVRGQSGNQRQQIPVRHASSGQICLTRTNTVKNRVCLNRSSDTAGRVCAMRAADAAGQIDTTRRVKSFNYARQPLLCAMFFRPENGDAARRAAAAPRDSFVRLRTRACDLRWRCGGAPRLSNHHDAFRRAVAGRCRTVGNLLAAAAVADLCESGSTKFHSTRRAAECA
jgi:hypothetical protein